MTTLIDALKGLLGKLEDYDPTDGRRECDRYELQKVQLVEEIAHQLSEIIAEHERSAEPKSFTRWDLVDSNPMGYEPNRVMQKDDSGEWVLWEDVEKLL